MKRKQHSGMKTAFTLIELIIVIAIIAILGVIAFLIVTKWIIKSKDASRSSDIRTIQKALSVGMVDIGYYPKPENSTTISYSDDTYDENGESTEIWDQGVFGSGTLHKLSNIDKIPIDPLSKKEYTYSVTKDGRKFQVGAIYEEEVAFNDIASSVYARNNTIQAMVRGNYENIVMQITVGEGRKKTNCLVTIPSIMLAHISGTGLNLNDQEDAYFVFDKEFNLPSSYEGSLGTTRNGAYFKPASAYCSTDLSVLADTHSQAYKEFIEKLIQKYSELNEQLEQHASHGANGTGNIISIIKDIASLSGDNTIFSGNQVNITNNISNIINSINSNIEGAGVSENTQGLPDYNPPILTRLLPNGVVNTADITIHVKTDEMATCAYSSEDKEYDDMENIFENTRDYEHTTPFTLTQNVETTLYIRCRDDRANKNTESKSITVKYVDNSVYANINFTDDDETTFECPTCEQP